MNRPFLVLSFALGLFAAMPAVAPRIACAQTHAASTADTVGAALAQFESATLWQSMRPSWRDRRTSWLAQVHAANTPQQLAALMIEFETIMTWDAMAPTWRQQRPGWITASRGAASAHDLAHQLLVLEAATTWHAVDRAHWAPVRDAWVARLHAL